MRLIRSDMKESGIFGTLQSNDVEFTCLTLEHSFDGRPALPPGTYLCKRSKHRLEGMEHDFTTFEVQNVPSHTGVLFHWGNTNADSSGCILLGETRIADELRSSRNAFARFMEYMTQVDIFTLDVSNGPLVQG